MTPEQKAAYVIAQTACMMVTLEAMRLENADCERYGRPRTYGPSDFSALPETFGVHHNAVVTFFSEGQS